MWEGEGDGIRLYYLRDSTKEDFSMMKQCVLIMVVGVT
jgi:hypothetical protein